MLLASLLDASMLPASHFIVSELRWALQIFRYSVWAGKPTPGTALMNLRYRNEAALHSSAKGAPEVLPVAAVPATQGCSEEFLYRVPSCCPVLLHHRLGAISAPVKKGLLQPSLN